MVGDCTPADMARFKRADVIKGWSGWEPPIPAQNPDSLPLTDLDPEAFESLVAEIVSRRDNRNVQFYGRSGQKQYGLDVVEWERSGTYCLYQVKRYQKISPAQLRTIVEKYAGPPRCDRSEPPRLFDPRRFVVAISAAIESDTAIVDAATALQGAYENDLEIVFWGAEALGRMLRDAPHLVYAAFGKHWAEAWCGFTPGPTTTPAPAALGLIDGPVDALNLDSAERDAVLAEKSADHHQAAVLYGSIARILDENHFPGHSVVMRLRQARALQSGGERDAAFAVRFDLAVQQALGSESSVYRSEHYELARMEPELTPAQKSRLDLVECIAGWGDVGTDLAVAVPALRLLVDERDPYAAALCCRVVEQALTDGLFDFVPPRSSLIKQYRQQGSVPWNRNGFGNKEPGRVRDGQLLDANHFDVRYPINLDLRVADLEGQVALADAVSKLKGTLPYMFRCERELSKSQLVLDFKSGPRTVSDVIATLVRGLGRGWQGTALPGYVILYRDHGRLYPSALRVYLSDGSS